MFSKKEKHLGAIKRAKLQRLWRTAKKETLIFLAVHAKNESVRRIAFSRLSKREDLSVDDIYELMIGEDWLYQDLWNLFLKLGATVEDLSDIVQHEHNFFRNKAWQELIFLINKRRVRTGRSERILIDIFTHVPEFRERSLSLLEKLDPSPSKLRPLLDLPFLAYCPEMATKIEQLIRNRTKKDRQDRFADEIQKLSS